MCVKGDQFAWIFQRQQQPFEARGMLRQAGDEQLVEINWHSELLTSLLLAATADGKFQENFL